MAWKRPRGANQVVAKATITNYSLPDPKLLLGFRVSVDYSVDPDRVQAILLDEAMTAVGQVPGLLHEAASSVSLSPVFDESPLDFNVGYSVLSYVDQFPVQHERRRRVLRRLRAEGVSLAVPVRSILVNGDPRQAREPLQGTSARWPARIGGSRT